MPFYYKGQTVNISSDNDAYYTLARSGFFREYTSKPPLMEKLISVTRELPIGAEVRIEKVYHPKRGYEPDAPFSLGDIAEEQILRLLEYGSFYDPATGKSKPPKWKVIRRSVRKSKNAPWEVTRENPTGLSGTDIVRVAGCVLAAGMVVCLILTK